MSSVSGKSPAKLPRINITNHAANVTVAAVIWLRDNAEMNNPMLRNAALIRNTANNPSNNTAGSTDVCNNSIEMCAPTTATRRP